MIGVRSRARIGLLGGTFDPPHLGHVVAAVEARHDLDLDVVLLVVANDPWQKSDSRRVTAAADRLAMTAAAVAGIDGLQVDDREIRRGGPSYTVDTVEEVAAEHPGADLFVIVGADAAAHLDTWERAGDLARLATVAVVARPGTHDAPRPAGYRWAEVPMPLLDVSSTDLRARVRAGRPIDGLVPPGVALWVRDRGLYRVAG